LFFDIKEIIIPTTNAPTAPDRDSVRDRVGRNIPIRVPITRPMGNIQFKKTTPLFFKTVPIIHHTAQD